MRVLNLEGYVCPYPAIAISKRLKEINKGEKLEFRVIVTDCDALKSLPKIAKKFGCKVEEIEELEKDKKWKLTIRK